MFPRVLHTPGHRQGTRGSDPLTASLRERFGHLIHEAAKFGVVGAAGFVVNMAGFDLIYYDVRFGSTRPGSFTAYTLSFIAASVVTYLGNRFWTFRHRGGRGTARDSMRFLVLNLAGMGIQYFPLGVTDHLLGRKDWLSANVALVVGVGLAMLFRFWSYRRWVWGTPAGVLPAGQLVPAGAGAAAYADAAAPDR